ncbi:MAG: hypothetical protein J3R72DRAFT_444211 [Linnemannia gamsii]|nr:MAG: hypothetical protein J3R72DRAFT_444211 [Linnemannia gamsii]
MLSLGQSIHVFLVCTMMMMMMMGHRPQRESPFFQVRIIGLNIYPPPNPKVTPPPSSLTHMARTPPFTLIS